MSFYLFALRDKILLKEKSGFYWIFCILNFKYFSTSDIAKKKKKNNGDDGL